MDNEQKIKQLENRVNELEKKFKSLENGFSIPPNIVEALISRGFQNVSNNELVLYSEGGVGANTFVSKYRVTKFCNKNEYYDYSNGIKHYSVNTSTDTCFSPNHGFNDGNYLSFLTTDSGVGLPSPIDTTLNTYYVINATQNTFQITIDGINPINLTDGGTGEQFAFAY